MAIVTTMTTEIVVCGQITLDIIPDLSHVPLTNLQIPGSFSPAGSLRIAAGGCVGNTGIALHKLGANVRLMAYVGNDVAGSLLRETVEAHCPSLGQGIGTKRSGDSPYTIVLSPSHIDRMFLHSAGLNQSFGINDIDFSSLTPRSIFHFGYPTVLPRMYADNGIELSDIMRIARECGAITSMDLSMPNAAPEAQSDWRNLLRTTLPYVDIFIPSLEELVFMLRPDVFNSSFIATIDRNFLESLLDELLHYGVVIGGIKLGEGGMIVKASDQKHLGAIGVSDSAAGDIIYQPAYEVTVSGTTGAGDCAYAGLLYALATGANLETAAKFACAVAAHSVESPESAVGLPPAGVIYERVISGWRTLPPMF